MIDSRTLFDAIIYLRRQAERVEPAGLGAWRINGIVQTADELLAYANDLRQIDCHPPIGFTSHPGGHHD